MGAKLQWMQGAIDAGCNWCRVQLVQVAIDDWL